MTTTATRGGLCYSGFCLPIITFVAFLLFSLTTVADAQNVIWSKAFLPSVIGPGSVSTLEFSIQVDGTGGVEEVAFTDVLPGAMTVAYPSAATTDCVDGVITAAEGSSVVSFSGARIGAGVTCSVSVNVTAAAFGTYLNISGDLTSSGGNAGPVSAELVVADDRPGFTKIFSPDTVSLGGRSTLILTVDNTANAEALAFLFFTDNLPPGMAIASPSNASTTCQNDLIPATLTAEPGSSVIDFRYQGTGSFPAPDLCQVTVDVVANTAGSLGNITGELESGLSTTRTSGKASAILTVPLSPFAFTKSFTNDPARQGATTELEFSIRNLSREQSATNISFTDDLDAVLAGLASNSGTQADVCGAGSTLDGTGTLTLSGGALAPGESCTFAATLDVPSTAAPGGYRNTTSDITATVGGGVLAGLPASDVLFVSALGPRLTKVFTDDPTSPGSPVTLQFTIDNTAASALTEIAFDDELTTFLPFPVSATLPADGFCGPASSMTLALPGTDRQALSMTGGSLGVGASCTFDVIIDIPAEMPFGTYVNTTGAITAMSDAEQVDGDPASDTLEIVAPPTLRKAFVDPVVAPGDSVLLEFSLMHGAEAPGEATDIAFTDNLETALSGLASTSGSLFGICGPGSSLTGTTLLEFTGGRLAPGEECSFSVVLAVPAGTPFGTFVNRTDTVSANVGGLFVTGNRAESELQVSALTLSKEFTDDPVFSGEPVTLEFTLTNVSTQNASGIFFTDNLDDTLPGLVSTSGTQSDVCGAGSALQGTSFLFFTGGTLDAGASCTFQAQLQVPSAVEPGTYGNVTSDVNATINDMGVTSPGATDVLTVLDADTSLVLAKEFTDDPVSPGSTVTLEFTLSYTGRNDAVDIAFTDNLDGMLSGLQATGLPVSNVCGMGSQLDGTSVLTFSAGSLLPGTACTFAVTLQVPEGASGSHTNTTSDVTATVGGQGVVGPPASDDLQIESGGGRNSAIGDFVWYDINGDGVQNEPGQPGLGGVTVALNTGACPGTPVTSTTTTEAGFYTFTDLAPGDYCVDVDENTVVLPEPGAAAVLTTANDPLTVTLSAGERFDDADFGYDTLPVSTTPVPDVPQEYALRANYPNPFNPTTTIAYDLPQLSEVTLTIIDVLGRQLAVLASGTDAAGRYEVIFDASDLPSGIYLYRLQAGDFIDTKRMVVVK